MHEHDRMLPSHPPTPSSATVPSFQVGACLPACLFFSPISFSFSQSFLVIIKVKCVLCVLHATARDSSSFIYI